MQFIILNHIKVDSKIEKFCPRSCWMTIKKCCFLKYFGFNSKIMHCKYLRSPSAITVVGMLDNRNILSIMHRIISSWLNALLILGFLRIYIAQAFPTNPKIIKTVEMTPVNQNFHSIRLWKEKILDKYKSAIICKVYIICHWRSSKRPSGIMEKIDQISGKLQTKKATKSWNNFLTPSYIETGMLFFHRPSGSQPV